MVVGGVGFLIFAAMFMAAAIVESKNKTDEDGFSLVYASISACAGVYLICSS